MTGQPKDGGGARRPCPSDHGILRDGEACGSCGGVMSPDPSGVGSSLELERPGTGAVDLPTAARHASEMLLGEALGARCECDPDDGMTCWRCECSEAAADLDRALRAPVALDVLRAVAPFARRAILHEAHRIPADEAADGKHDALQSILDDLDAALGAAGGTP